MSQFLPRLFSQLLDVGARAQTLARLLNQCEGFAAADDRLPRRVMQAFDSGLIAGIGIAQADFDWFRRRFYELMKWDRETGAPTDGCGRDLGLDLLLPEYTQSPV